MGWKQMKVADVIDGGGREFAFEYSQELAGAGNGDWILVPDDIIGISVTISVVTATAKAQTTTDPIGIVKSGSGITAVDWPSGLVALTTQDFVKPITAIRLVQVGVGSSKLTLRCQ